MASAFPFVRFHMGLFIDGALSASNPFHLTLVFFAGYLSLSFGIADFVLYIWVDDVFVRRNKILSTAQAKRQCWFSAACIFWDAPKLCLSNTDWIKAANSAYRLETETLFFFGGKNPADDLRKLVTAHYCVEIISRLPTLAFFHYACKSAHAAK